MPDDKQLIDTPQPCDLCGTKDSARWWAADAERKPATLFGGKRLCDGCHGKGRTLLERLTAAGLQLTLEALDGMVGRLEAGLAGGLASMRRPVSSPGPDLGALVVRAFQGRLGSLWPEVSIQRDGDRFAVSLRDGRVEFTGKAVAAAPDAAAFLDAQAYLLLQQQDRNARVLQKEADEAHRAMWASTFVERPRPNAAEPAVQAAADAQRAAAAPVQAGNPHPNAPRKTGGQVVDELYARWRTDGEQFMAQHSGPDFTRQIGKLLDAHHEATVRRISAERELERRDGVEVGMTSWRQLTARVEALEQMHRVLPDGELAADHRELVDFATVRVGKVRLERPGPIEVEGSDPDRFALGADEGLGRNRARAARARLLTDQITEANGRTAIAEEERDIARRRLKAAEQRAADAEGAIHRRNLELLDVVHGRALEILARRYGVMRRKPDGAWEGDDTMRERLRQAMR